MISRTNVSLEELSEQLNKQKEKLGEMKALLALTNNARWHYKQYKNFLLSMNKMLEKINKKEEK